MIYWNYFEIISKFKEKNFEKNELICLIKGKYDFSEDSKNKNILDRINENLKIRKNKTYIYRKTAQFKIWKQYI